MKRGFTLIELLVVISIIGLLSSIVLATLVDARQKAINTQVRSTMEAYVTAMALYYDNYGYYPTPTPNSATVCFGQAPCLYYGSAWPTDSAITTGLNPYIANTPPVGTDIIVQSGSSFQGAVYHCTSFDSNSNCIKVTAIYRIKGTQALYCYMGNGTPDFSSNITVCQYNFLP
jgi:prepilin-type N-terminal cleavage/methylation domain-containing protein